MPLSLYFRFWGKYLVPICQEIKILGVLTQDILTESKQKFKREKYLQILPRVEFSATIYR